MVSCWYLIVFKCWRTGLTQPSQNLRDGIRYPRFTRSIRIDDITGFWVAVGSSKCPCFASQTGHIFLDIKSGSYNNAYIFQEIQRINKQMTTKPIVDYFQRVCDATIMHETSHRRGLKRHTICGNRPWIDTKQHLTYTQHYQKQNTHPFIC